MLIKGNGLFDLLPPQHQVVHVSLAHDIVQIDGIAKGFAQCVAQEVYRLRRIHWACQKGLPGS